MKLLDWRMIMTIFLIVLLMGLFYLSSIAKSMRSIEAVLLNMDCGGVAKGASFSPLLTTVTITCLKDK